jgi:hypothetical protein
LHGIGKQLDSHMSVLSVPIPLNCTDGFSEAYYGRPELLLDPGARRANSAWSFVDPLVETRFVDKLENEGVGDQWNFMLRTP